jgi:hypothetical protein
MKTILILGAGTAGTAIAHKMRRRLSTDWEVAVVDPSTTHLCQPGLLFLPFGDETEERIVRERGSTLGKGITWHQATVKGIDTEDLAPSTPSRVRALGSAKSASDRKHRSRRFTSSSPRVRQKRSQKSPASPNPSRACDQAAQERPMTDPGTEKKRSLSVICSKGSFDMAYPGLILANAARMAGVDARLFFTFRGSTSSTRRRLTTFI